MRRAAMICSVVSGVLILLGVVESLTNYKWSAGDQNAIFGNPRLLANDGITVLIAGGFLALVSATMWVLARRKGQGAPDRTQ
jgi:vacuolar-type H+-ATPase subunit I/STV1